MAPLWTLSIVLAVGVLLVIALSMGRQLFPGTRVVVDRLYCPFRKAKVEIGFVETVWDNRRVDVESCSAFIPPTAVACDRRCVQVAGAMARW